MPPGSKAPAGTWVGARVCGGCVCLAGSVHRAACHSRSGGERPGSGIKAPRSGLASQTSRCIKKSQRPLSPLSGQSTGRWGRRALPRTGGSDEAGAVALLVLSLPLLVFMPHLEKPSAGDLKKKKKMCAWRAAGAGRARAAWVAEGDAEGRCTACPGVASGLMADAGAVARLLRLRATAALCGRRQLHGWVSNHYTEHLQTDKKTKPSGASGNFCFPFSFYAVCPRPSPPGCWRRG